MVEQQLGDGFSGQLPALEEEVDLHDQPVLGEAFPDHAAGGADHVPHPAGQRGVHLELSERSRRRSQASRLAE